MVKLHYVTQVAPYRDGPAGAHGVLDQSARAMAELAGAAGLELVHVDDVSELPAEDLGHDGVLALFTIGETPWNEAQREAIASGVRDGRLSLLAIHAATDACYGWDEYGHLLGARFDGHPWTQEITIDVVDGDHPSTAHLGSTWRWHDEVYLFRDLRGDARILLRARHEDLDQSAPGARRPDHGYPLAWTLSGQHGRLFYTALGHFPGAWENPVYLRHLAGGLDWVLGREGR